MAVDVVYHDPRYAEPWHLLVPCWARLAWAPAQIVQLYHRRMHIEQSFRDSKTHLGVRGLQFRARVPERLGYLLAFCLVYAVVVLLGVRPGRGAGPDAILRSSASSRGRARAARSARRPGP